VPKPIRDAMRAWQFEDATALIQGAEDVLALRADVQKAAHDAGLVAPAGLRLAFENDDGFDDATAEASSELQTVERYTEAVARRPTQLTPLISLGMWGETPEADLVAARDAFARGDMSASAHASDEAAASWSNAESIGQGRAFSIGTLVLFGLMALGLFFATFRRRRRQRRASMAHRIAGR
jgi:cbb3-type cytochrome oxidase subunit 3